MKFLYPLLLLIAISCFHTKGIGQVSYERNVIGGQFKYVKLDGAISLENGSTILYGESTLVGGYYQASAIAIDSLGNELWRYGYGNPESCLITSCLFAFEQADTLRLLIAYSDRLPRGKEYAFVNLGYDGQAFDTTYFSIDDHWSVSPKKLAVVDSSTSLMLFQSSASNGELLILGIDKAGNEIYRVDFSDFTTNFPRYDFIKLGDEIGILGLSSVYKIDDQNGQLIELTSFPPVSLRTFPVKNEINTIIDGFVEVFAVNSFDFEYRYRELDSEGRISFDQELEWPQDFYPDHSIRLDSLLVMYDYDSEGDSYLVLNLNNSGKVLGYYNSSLPDDFYYRNGFSANLLGINGEPYISQAFQRKGVYFSDEISVISLLTQDTLANYHDYNDSSFFSYPYFWPTEDLIYAWNFYQEPEDPWPYMVAVDYSSGEVIQRVYGEGFPSVVSDIRFDETSKSLTFVTGIYDSSSVFNNTPRFLHPVIQRIDSLGNMVWTHEVIDNNLDYFYLRNTRDGYISKSARGINPEVFISTNGRTGETVWEYPIIGRNTWLPKLLDVKEFSDTTILSYHDYFQDSTALVHDIYIAGIDANGSELWALRFDSLTQINQENFLISVVKDSIDFVALKRNGTTSSASVPKLLWMRVSIKDGSSRVVYEAEESFAIERLFNDFVILDYQRLLVISHTDANYSSLGIFDLRDSTYSPVFLETDVDAKKDIYYRKYKFSDMVILSGTANADCNQRTLVTKIFFEPRVQPAFQKPDPEKEIARTGATIQLLKNPVSNSIQFVSSTDIPLGEIGLYSTSGRRLTDLQISLSDEGVYEILLTTPPAKGIYFLNAGGESVQVAVY